MHLCANILLSNMIPVGMKIRRNFSFWPGEKSFLNRAYRGFVDCWLSRRHRLPDYFFDLTQCIEQKKLERVAALAKSHNVELMTHPVLRTEADYLMSDEYRLMLERLEPGGYSLV
jgi:chitin disaccharide deacetylase